MSTPRDIHAVRPSTQHRHSLATTPTSLPSRQSTARSVSQATSVGSYSQTHRVNRRKSTASSAGFNVNALAAAIRDTTSLPGAASQRPAPAGTRVVAANAFSMDLDSPSENAKASDDDDVDKSSSAVVDGPPLSTSEKATKSRTRRASEGTKAAKLERSKSVAGELRCDKCGKGYKHGSCLTKHLWEHTPEWALTSKLLISKHQQVQLLEAASVLVTMNQDDKVPLEVTVQRVDRDTSSESPVASGSSDPNEADDSSSRTSTPSADESDPRSGRFPSALHPSHFARAMSRSYQSTFASSAPNEASGLSYYRQWSSDDRSTSANNEGMDNEEQADLAAAAEGLLTCSLGTPKPGPAQPDQDIPPVPPLPAKYTISHRKHASTQGQDSDVRMADDVDVEDDEGVFGRME